jgi:peroxiredoxin
MVDFEVTELAPTDHVRTGETAPDFTRPLVNEGYWEDASLSELTDRGPVLLHFHPMDGDFVPVYVWQEIVERGWARSHDVTPVGVSISTPYEHKSFIREWDLPFALFSDPANDVADRYGVVNDLDGMAGVEEPRPAIFLLADDRTVEYAWVASEWPEFPEYDDVEAAIEAL